MSADNIPRHLKHTPIYSVDYESIDVSGDAKYLSIGQAQWDDARKDISAKVFRETDSGRWSPQSEELPLWRVFDLAIMISSVIKNGDGGNGTNCQSPKCVSKTKKGKCVKFIVDNKDLQERMKELKDLLNSIDL